VEHVDDVADNDWQILLHYIDNIEKYSITHKLLDDGTVEYYIYLSDTYYLRYFSNRAAITSSISIPAVERWSYDILSRLLSQPTLASMGPSMDGELIDVQTVRIYYCTFGGDNGRMDFSDRHLIWEK